MSNAGATSERDSVGLDVMIPAFQAADAERRSRALVVLLDGDDSGEAADEMPHAERWLNQMELAERLGVHPTTVRRWRLPCRRLGRLPRYLWSEVEAHMNSRTFKRRLAELKAERRG